MKRVLLTLGVACVTLAVAATAFANTQPDARIALHLKGDTTKNRCTTWTPNSDGTPCSLYDVSTNTVGGEIVRAYLVVAWFDAGPGIGGVSVGVENTGLFVNWELCADLDFPNSNWSTGNGGNRITWDVSLNCQNTEVGGEGGHAVAGNFYLYSYGGAESLTLVENQVQSGPELVVADCAAIETNLPLERAGAVGLNGPGYNPCEEVPVEDATWGAIKKKYNN